MNRRDFLKKSAQIIAASSTPALLPRLFASQAFAQSSTSYKAIICLYLPGGNDGNNTLVPIDAQYSEYARGRGPLALSKSTLLPLRPTSSGRVFGLHPSLSSVASSYNAGDAAFLVNTGPLTSPVSKQSLTQGTQAPVELFSHTAQQAEWQSAITQSIGTSGWAGRIADTIPGNASQLPTVISTAGWNLLGQGLISSPVSTGFGSNTVSVFDALQTLNPILSAMESGPTKNDLQADIARMQSTYIGNTTTLLATIKAGSTLKTAFPSTSIGQQLQTIAQIINGRSVSRANQQVFFSQDQQSYDTHENQSSIQSNNLANVDAAICSFITAMQEIGMFDNITLFTMTDFARSHVSNSSGGSDHAWGNHHLIVGGSVKGGDVYGTFPSLELGGQDDFGTTGLWIPSTSGSQYAATLAKWLGVNASTAQAIFPELSNFQTPYLSFL